MPNQGPSTVSLRAKDHGLKLGSVNDALDVLSSGLPARIFTPEDLHPYSPRVTELIRDHRQHAYIRFYTSPHEAQCWLTGAGRV